RFLKHFTVKDNDGIRPQYRQVAWHARNASLRFLTRQARNILLSTFALSTFFFDAGNDTFKSDAQLREQLLTTWRTGGKIDRRHRNLLLHSKLLANLTHQQEQPRPEHTVDYTTPEYFGSERDVDH